MIRGIKLTQSEFITTEKEITKILSPFKEFTSPTYQKKGIETNDGFYILLEPKQQIFKDALDIEFIDLDKSIIKQPEEI